MDCECIRPPLSVLIFNWFDQQLESEANCVAPIFGGMRLNIAHQLSYSSALNASISGCIRAIQQIKLRAISTSHRSDRAALYQTISCGRSPFLKLNWLFRYSCNIASFLIAFNKPSSTFF